MRGAFATVLLLLPLGCASTVSRLDGEFPTPAGPARTACEQADWLVVAPTRADFLKPNGERKTTRVDGVGLYRVGEDRPESIPSLGEKFDNNPVFLRHEQDVRFHDRKQLIAGGLGVAGVVALTVGTILFVSSFQTERGSNGDEEHSIDGGSAIAGGVLLGAGFGLGIAGIAVNPGQAERSDAEAARYVFLPPQDRREDVVSLAGRHNQAVRDRCVRAPAP